MASVQTPDFVDLFIIPARFESEGLGWVRFDLPKALGQLIPLIRDDNDLAIGDADQFISKRRLWIAPGLLIDSTGHFAVQVLDGVGD